MVEKIIVGSALLALLLIALPWEVSLAEETCEMTIEEIVPATSETSKATPENEFSSLALEELRQGRFSWERSGKWRLAKKETIPFPAPGEVQIIGLGGNQVYGVELRHLRSRRPDWFILGRNGRPLGSPSMQCPKFYSNGFTMPTADRLIVFTAHPPGPIREPGSRVTQTNQ